MGELTNPTVDAVRGAPPVFISYRRVDRDQFAEPFYKSLTDWFGPDAVFLDRKNIELTLVDLI